MYILVGGPKFTVLLSSNTDYFVYLDSFRRYLQSKCEVV